MGKYFLLMHEDNTEVEKIITHFRQRAEKCLVAACATKFYTFAQKEGFQDNDLKVLLAFQNSHLKKYEAIKSKTLGDSLLRKMFHPDKTTNPGLKKLITEQLFLFLKEAPNDKNTAVKATKYTLNTISYILAASPLLSMLLILRTQKYQKIMGKIASMQNIFFRKTAKFIIDTALLKILPVGFQLLFVDPAALFDEKTIKLQNWLINIIDSIMIKIFIKESSEGNSPLLKIENE